MNVDAEFERKLSARLKSGDEGAYRDLLATYGDILFRQIRYKVETIEDAEDIVSETFISFYTSVDKFELKGPGALLGFLVTLNNRRLGDYYKKLNAKKRGSEHKKVDLQLDSYGGGSSEDPAVIAEQKEEGDSLRREVNALDGFQSELLRKLVYEGMEYEELSEQTGRSKDSLYVARSKAIAHLKSKMRAG